MGGTIYKGFLDKIYKRIDGEDFRLSALGDELNSCYGINLARFSPYPGIGTGRWQGGVR
jgi:hypothetical protein